MGLYDDVYIDYPMPSGYEKYQTCAFQTKDLECYMEEYHITKTGNLYLRTWDIEDIPETERTANALGWILTTRRAETYTDQQILYHGDIIVYTSVKGKGLQDFIIRFTYGKIDYIIPFKDRNNLITRYEVMHEEQTKQKETETKTE